MQFADEYLRLAGFRESVILLLVGNIRNAIRQQGQPLSHAIITNAKALVEAQQFLFDTLWNQLFRLKIRY